MFRDKVSIVLFIILVMLVLLLAVCLWPTRYVFRYEIMYPGGKPALVQTDRLTGQKTAVTRGTQVLAQAETRIARIAGVAVTGGIVVVVVGLFARRRSWGKLG